MNLMFWKKKTGAEEEAAQEDLSRNKRESLDFIAAQPSAAAPESPEATPGTAEMPQEPAARSGSWLDSLLRRFRKTPPFRADVEPAPDATEIPEKPGSAAEPDSESPDLEAPAKPGWAAWIKLQVAALLQRSRKTPAPDTGEEQAGEPGEAGEPAEAAAPTKAGLFARLRAGFSAFVRELKAPAAAAGEERDESEEAKASARGRPEAESFEEATEEAPGTKPARSRRLLVIGAILLALLLAAGIGFALLPLLEPPEKRWGTKHDTTSISSRPLEQDAASGEPQTEVDALRKENAELQARLEALRKEPTPQQATVPPPRQFYVPPLRQGREGTAAAAAPAAGEELTIGTSDPKAAAMTLKEAIEAMNAASGDSARKPAK